MTTTAQKRHAFRDLHREGCFLIPNPWDAGSARMLQSLGFKALATTSSGFAWTTGKDDYGMARESVLHHLTTLCAAVDVPVNADFEAGFGQTAAAVADSVRLASQAGVAALSIEDHRAGENGFYDLPEAVERVRAALSALREDPEPAMLVARTELLLYRPEALGEAIERLLAFAEAGADCLYAPGARKPDDIAAIVKAVAPLPVNVLAMGDHLTLADYAALGVRRVSIGGGLAKVAWTAAIAAARALQQGSFSGLTGSISGAELAGLLQG